MQKRKLGDLEVSALGLGCMGMSFAYSLAGVSDNESIKLIQKAVDLGITFFDTAQVYGPHTNEELLGKALQGIRERVIIATKFGFKFENGQITGVDSSPKNVKAVAESSLKRLKTDAIDLYYQHRVDRTIPVEETVGAMSELVKEGKVRCLGLSEAGPETIRRAHAIHPIAALQSEYSLWERGLEEKIIPVLNELGIGLVPFSPLGRGFLGGKFSSVEQIAENDSRKQDPRLEQENFQANLKLLDKVKSIALNYKASPAQIALSWLFSRGPNIVPIPGTTKIERLKENCEALNVILSENDKEQLNNLATITQGARYHSRYMALVER